MYLNAFAIALREIRRNLSRSILTMLGVIIGVGAVIVMVTLGNGATQQVKSQISNLGSNLLILIPGQGFGGRSASGVPLFSTTDAEMIEKQIPGIQYIAPVISTYSATYHLQNARNSSIVGTLDTYFPIGNWQLDQGTFFSKTDVKQGRAVAIIGQTIVRELFKNENPIGQKIRIGSTSVDVIGTLKSKGQTGFGRDQDDTIILPISTMQRRITGTSSPYNISQIMISGQDGYPTDNIVTDINALMRERRNLHDAEENNFNVIDTRQIAETVSASTRILTTLLAAVASVSLFVGGIGIMNIMLVSVTERTREIGIRLAIGARAKEVLLQFLIEAITLSCLGGLIGITLAFLLCRFLAAKVGVPFQLDLTINLIAFAFSALIGIIFGFLPARRAASLDPIDALRYE